MSTSLFERRVALMRLQDQIKLTKTFMIVHAICCLINLYGVGMSVKMNTTAGKVTNVAMLAFNAYFFWRHQSNHQTMSDLYEEKDEQLRHLEELYPDKAYSTYIKES